ncbi:MAG: cadherin-like domain-containing protein, partial [Hyphomicrobiaceae bacterium]
LEDTTLTVNAASGLLTNDSDLDGDAITVTQFTVGGTTYTAGSTAALTEGDLTINGDGSYTFVPALNYNGPVPVATYTISDGALTDTATLTLAVTPVNDAPTAADDSGSTAEDTTLTVNAASGLLTNDSDLDGDAITVSQFTVGGSTYTAGSTASLTEGDLTINGDGSYTFVPATNFNGPVPVATYTISDGALTDTATLTLAVTPVNDAPIAGDDTVDTPEDTGVTIPILLNDSDPDGGALTVTTVAAPANGSVTLNADGSLRYTPNVGFTGVDSFNYTIENGLGVTDTATVTVSVGLVPESFSPLEEEPDATPPPQSTDLEELTADGAVLDALRAINGEPVNGGIGVNGIVVTAANNIASLNGIERASEPLPQQRLWQMSDKLTEAGGLSAYDAERLTGFSLRMGLTDDFAGTSDKAQVIIETMVRDKVLIIQLSNTLDQAERKVVEFRVTQADGRPLPQWLDRIDRGTLMGERPADLEQVGLRVTVVYNDGTNDTRTVEIQTHSGEIQPVLEQRAPHAPKLFDDQFNPTEIPADGSLEALSDLLIKKG